MKLLPKRPPKAWWSEGDRPDYRFSLANERTFLAWIRTGLALLAGALAVMQFGSSIYSTPVQKAVTTILLASSLWISFLSYRKWSANEYAMRIQGELPRDHGGVVLAVVFFMIVSLTAFDLCCK